MAIDSQQATTKICILISGNGSNLQALIDACDTPSLPSASIVRVISNRKDAFGLKRAEKAGIPTAYHNLLAYKKRHPATEEGIGAARSEYDKDLAALVMVDKPDMVVCAGWMHILAPTFLDRWRALAFRSSTYILRCQGNSMDPERSSARTRRLRKGRLTRRGLWCTT